MQRLLRRRQPQSGQSGLNGDIKRAPTLERHEFKLDARPHRTAAENSRKNKSAAEHRFASNFLCCLYLANQVGQRHLHSSQTWRWPQSACKELLQRTQLYLCQI